MCVRLSSDAKQVRGNHWADLRRGPLLVSVRIHAISRGRNGNAKATTEL
jgi:hypothetical protein